MFNDIESKLNSISEGGSLDRETLAAILSTEDGASKNILYRYADKTRAAHMGDGITLRGIVEFSNVCAGTCVYCGLNRYNTKLKRYDLESERILASVAELAAHKIKTVVLQSGENHTFDGIWFGELISEIKDKFGIRITLSVGEKPYDVIKHWKDKGADRYLLKIETSNKNFYDYLHPGMSFENRLRTLKDLKELGYQVGSGIIVGLFGQTTKMLADDIIFLKENDFDMVAIGPFIPHVNTDCAGHRAGSAEMTLKTLALARVVTKNAHMPSTTALGVIDSETKIKALSSGANVIMVNFTPERVKDLYSIYDGKSAGSGKFSNYSMEKMAAGIKRHIDYSEGDSLKAPGVERVDTIVKR
ncbi:MAG: [FeFe] hydrogenase H-cluster radical SAM maturase HydE [Candidatus Omnitrophica bacterium]|nr:[FeFe] hydrogenase H-cluster radical SAM maturase HydE [Candidatus Omnitrophota bacterium]